MNGCERSDACELVAYIHDRMPLILVPGGYARWLGKEADRATCYGRSPPTGCGRFHPVNKPENDHSSLESEELATDATWH